MSMHRRLITIAVSLWCALAFTILAVSLYLLATGHASASTRDDVEREISGAFERSEWTRQERRAFALSVIGHAIDLGSSLASDERCIERNAILGERPSAGALIGLKLMAIGFEWWLYSSPRFRNQPTHYYGYTSALIHAGIAASNLRNKCY